MQKCLSHDSLKLFFAWPLCPFLSICLNSNFLSETKLTCLPLLSEIDAQTIWYKVSVVLEIILWTRSQSQVWIHKLGSVSPRNHSFLTLKNTLNWQWFWSLLVPDQTADSDPCPIRMHFGCLSFEGVVMQFVWVCNFFVYNLRTI